MNTSLESQRKLSADRARHCQAFILSGCKRRDIVNIPIVSKKNRTTTGSIRLRPYLFLMIALCLCQATVLSTQTEGALPSAVNLLPDWQISGSNTYRMEYYDYKGDEAQAPYSSEGLTSYDEIGLNFSRRKNPYDLWKGDIFGVINGSPYRSSDYGIVAERLNLTREKGDIALPFRLELGDVYSYYTYRTLQTSLKGLQLDVQPFPNSEFRQSFLLTSGARLPSWRHLNFRDSYFNGGSYLIENPVFGRYSLNFVHNSRKSDESRNILERSQMVYSFSGQNTLQAMNQKILLEGEFSLFRGDHDGLTNSASGQNKSDKGLFFQASGSGRHPLTYRLRYEEYGEDYQPVGASITPALRNLEGHAGWLFPRGYQLRLRAQGRRNNLGGTNPTDTSLLGANLTGPLDRWMFTVQDAKNRTDTTDNLTHNVNLNLNIPKIAGWMGRLGYQYLNLFNRLPNSDDSASHQLSLSADHSLDFWGIQGAFTPGLVLRKINSDAGDSFDFSPTLAFRLTRGAHSLDYSLSRADQRRYVANGIDMLTTTQALNYRFTFHNHTLGLEFSSGYRNPDPGESIDYYKLAAFWTYSFDKPAKAPQKSKAMEEKREISDMPSATLDLASFAPGVNLEKIEKQLAARGIVGPTRQDNLVLYESRLFEEIDLRQRLALIQKNNVLNKSAIIIDFAYLERPDEIIQTFQRVLSLLLDCYGNPSDFYEKGELGIGLLSDIRSGRFVRLTEWSRPGGVIRFGIPRRLDGQVRMEIQFAESFPPFNETLWSLEEVK